MQVPIPPAGFEPATASAAQLQEYGFPPAPSSPTALSQWSTAMSDYSFRSVPDLELLVSNEGFQNGSGHYFSGWSGWAAINTSGGNSKFVTVEGNYTVPTVDPTYCPTYNYPPGFSIWVDIGGGIETDQYALMQAGIQYNWDENLHPSGPSRWTAFYEEIPAMGGAETLPYTIGDITSNISAGDQMWSYVGYEPSSKTVTYTLEDETTGQDFSTSEGNVSSGDWDGRTAEWLTEEAPSWPILPEFETFRWTNATGEYENGDWTTISGATDGQSSPIEDELGPTTGPYGNPPPSAVMARPEALGGAGESFDSYFIECNPNGSQ